MVRENTLGAHDTGHIISPQREWLVAADETPPLAAHVVSSRTGYTHHGIYVGDGKVVHYAGLSRGWRHGPVEEVSLTEFSRGRPVRVRPHLKSPFDCSDVVARARSRLGEDRYRILSNNCEHFCEWCVCGESRSPQIELWCTRYALLVVLRFLGRFAHPHSSPLSRRAWGYLLGASRLVVSTETKDRCSATMMANSSGPLQLD
jgi:hypothetical protein